MWSFGHHVREIERSHQHVLIEETATTGAVWLFGLLTLLVVGLIATEPKSWWEKPGSVSVGVGAVLFFAAWALRASVRSTFTADSRTSQFVIERKVLFWAVRTAYDAHSIDRIYIRDTPKGSGLYLRFKSGRKKRLSMSLEFDSLEEAAAALNSTLYIHHQR